MIDIIVFKNYIEWEKEKVNGFLRWKLFNSRYRFYF